MKRCDQCGEPARYVVGLSVRVFDLESSRDRLKELTVYLCEACEEESQQFLRRDAGQRARMAGAICTHTPRASPMVQWGRRGVGVSGD